MNTWVLLVWVITAAHPPALVSRTDRVSLEACSEAAQHLVPFDQATFPEALYLKWECRLERRA